MQFFPTMALQHNVDSLFMYLFLYLFTYLFIYTCTLQVIKTVYSTGVGLDRIFIYVVSDPSILPIIAL